MCRATLPAALALSRAGERARHVEIGYFVTRAGHGDELLYRSTLCDAYTLTTGGTRQTLVGAAAEDGFAYRPRAPGLLPVWSTSVPPSVSARSATPV